MFVNLFTDEMTARFAAAQLYQKKAEVTIREVPVGTLVRTILGDGTDETSMEATEERHFVVTNPGGEQYLISAEKRDTRYDHLHGDTYRAKGIIRAFSNPTGENVEILAPWGEEQRGGPSCLFAAAVASAEAPLGTDRYIIGGAEFAATYAPITTVS